MVPGAFNDYALSQVRTISGAERMRVVQTEEYVSWTLCLLGLERGTAGAVLIVWGSLLQVEYGREGAQTVTLNAQPQPQKQSQHNHGGPQTLVTSQPGAHE